MQALASAAHPGQLARRHLWAALANLALAGLYALGVWHEGAGAAPGQLDPSPLPYLGAFATAPAVAFSLSAAAALRRAPGRPWAPLLHEVASYAAGIGVAAGVLLLPVVL